MIGIIAAEEKEIEAIKKVMKNLKQVKHKKTQIYLGEISNKECIVLKSGVGKVNAARTTQLLIDKFEISEIINVGSAGSINSNIKYGDIVIGKELVQHDVDITAFGHPKGYITDIGVKFYSTPALIEKAYKVMEKIDKNENSIHIGDIASGDIFFTSLEGAKKLRQDFECDCVEMEGAAIAQVCFLEEIPYICIKSISDTPNGNNNIEFDQYLEMASKRCAEFLAEFVK